MAIQKSDASVYNLKVQPDGSVNATVNYLIADSGTEITRVTEEIVISNSTSGERTAAASLVSKAAAIAVG
tara:strand:- start:91 stop:300 length:210 start_codon:yes stop_codon:yes gene_type:complete